MPVVGWLGLDSPDRGSAPVFEGFRQGLRDLGHEEGRTILLEHRWARGDNAKFPALVRDLLDRHPAVIVSPCGFALRAIREVDRTLPVIAGCADPKNFLGEVASFNRPGGRTTGYTFLSPESVGKRLQLLKQLRPTLSRVAVVYQRGEAWDNYWQEMHRAAPQLGITLLKAPLERVEDVQDAIASAVQQRAEALIVIVDATTLSARDRIAALAIKYRLPTAFELRHYVVAGGLLSYGPDWHDLGRRVVAGYVDKILKGAAAGDLPIQQPTQFELVVNLRTARAIALTVPGSILAQTHEALE